MRGKSKNPQQDGRDLNPANQSRRKSNLAQEDQLTSKKIPLAASEANASSDLVETPARRTRLNSLTIAASDEVKVETKNLICDAWNTKAFSDVQILCGFDNGVVKTSRLFLSGLSSQLCKVLLEHNKEETIVMLPDVESKVLSDFLDNVCLGLDDVAVVDPSLAYLGFGNITAGSLKSVAHSGDSLELNQDKDSDANIAEIFSSSKSYLDESQSGERDQEVVEGGKTGTQKMKGPKTKSLVWKFFDRVGRTVSRCKVCKTELKADKGTTTSMHVHLKRFHSRVYMPALAVQGSRAALEPKPVVKLEVDKVDGEVDSEPRKGRAKVKRSLIWNYFEQLADTGSAKCNSCDKIIKTPDGSTSILGYHLRLKHSDEFEQLQQSRSEEDLLRARQKLMGPVPKSVTTADDDQESVKTAIMSEAAVKSSPLWTIFKAEEGDDELKVKCLKCDKIFPRQPSSTSQLIHHLRFNHSTAFNLVKNLLENPDQPDTFDPVNPIWEFFSISSDKLAQCNSCLGVLGIQDSGVGSMADHLGSTHPEAHLSYNASLSNWRHQREEELLAYQSSQKKSSNYLQHIWNYFDKVDNNDIEVVCKTCGDVIVHSERSLAEINRHVEQNHPDLYLQFLADTTGFKAVSKSEDLAVRTCPQCQKAFSTQYAMQAHLKTIHATVHPFQCHVCDKTFARADAYRSHGHIRISSYLCSQCGKQFTSSFRRNRHEETHFVVERVKCNNPDCDKEFASKQSLARHQLLHSGLKPFKCSQCSGQFARKQQLLSHQRTHTGEKPFACPCGKKFKFLASKNKHECEAKAKTEPSGSPPVPDVAQVGSVEPHWE